MDYNHFDQDRPAPGNARSTDINWIRYNLNALLDGMGSGVLPGWNYALSAGTGTELKPQYHIWTDAADANEKIRVTCTYDASDRVATLKMERSHDGGSTWDTAAKTGTFTYSATTGVCTAIAWS